MILEAIGGLLSELPEVMGRPSLPVDRVGNCLKDSVSLRPRTDPGVRSILMIPNGLKVRQPLGLVKDF